MEQFARHAEFGGPGKKGGEGGGQDFCGDHEHQAVGHGDEAAIDEDVGFAGGVVRSDELIAEAEGAAKLGGPGLFRDEGIRAGFDDAILDALGAENAAEMGRGFVESVVERAGEAMGFEGESGGESGDASADDCDAGHGVRLPESGFRRPASGFWLPVWDVE